MKSSGQAAPARVAALRVYEAVEHGSATLPDALAAVQATLEDARDRALTAEIVSGTFRWRAALDHALAARATRTLDTIDPAILGILRLSAYQLLFLDRVPARAVVFDAVALARAREEAERGRIRQRGAAQDRGGARDRPRIAVASPPRGVECGRVSRHLRLPDDHTVASAMARGAVGRALRVRCSRCVGAVQQCAGDADAAGEYAAHHA